MSKRDNINHAYDLPEAFYEKYLGPHRKPIKSKADLVELWEDALAHRSQYPTLQESIAEWTMSIGANTPFVNDNNLYEAIHAEFGALEADYPDTTQTETAWHGLAKLVEEAREYVYSRDEDHTSL